MPLAIAWPKFIEAKVGPYFEKSSIEKITFSASSTIDLSLGETRRSVAVINNLFFIGIYLSSIPYTNIRLSLVPAVR